jgi:hypothetical protein
MTHKEQILKLYPDAVLCKDTHNYGKQRGGEQIYIVLHQLPCELKDVVKNGIVTWDFQQRRDNIKMKPLGIWAITEQAAWETAWRRIQEKLQMILAE